MRDGQDDTLTKQAITDKVQDLLVVPDDHVLALQRARLRSLARELERDSTGRRPLWKDVGRELGLDDDELYNVEVSTGMLLPRTKT